MAITDDLGAMAIPDDLGAMAITDYLEFLQSGQAQGSIP
jgi:hypothetical protein